MNLIKSYIFTILTSAAFIYGSFLCALYGKCLQDLSKGSLLLFCTGFIIIAIGFLVINLLIKSTHPYSTVLHRIAFSACIPLLIFMGTNLIILKPSMHKFNIFHANDMSFFFGVYLVIFGVSFLHFLIKKNDK